MKTLPKILLAATALAGATPALAQSQVLFSGTGTDPRFVDAILTFDGVTSFNVVDTGYIASTGQHSAFNQNYFVGQAGTLNYNNYFSFLLGAAAPVSPYTSAVLSIRNGNSSGPLPIVYTLYDVAASSLELDTTRSAGNAGGQALFADLGSGTSFGSYTFTQPTFQEGFDTQYTNIVLNQAFLSQVNAGLLTNFSIGGTIGAAPAAAVPETATWGMMIAGFGVMGAALRTRRRSTKVSFA